MPVAPEHAGGGPVYFAWVDATETSFGPEHIRYDEYILKFDIVLAEGQLPVATFDMKNPGALLAPGRKRWAWFAFDDESGVTQKFFGSITGVPSSIFDQVITVQLIAKPLDYLARKQAVAETLKADPQFYDKIFIDPQFWDDPDTILEARAADWHFDPVSHAVSISDKLVGEDGEAEFFAADVLFGSVQFSIGTAPKGVVAMDASVIWTQGATGTIALPVQNVLSYTAQDLLSGWPKQGAVLDAGWSVESSSAVDRYRAADAYVKTFGFKYENKSKEHKNGDTLTFDETRTAPIAFGPTVELNKTQSISQVVGDPDTGKAASTSVQESSTFIMQSLVVGQLTLRYTAARDRTEHFKFTLSADLQPVLTDAGGTADIPTLTLKGRDVGQSLDPIASDGGDIPIGDAKRRIFFTTDRGRQAREYALNVARADLLADCRVASTSFDCPFRRALHLSCRMNAILHNPSLPGGVAVGKIMKLTLSGDGSSGLFKGNVVMGSAAGFGAAVEEVAGTPVYVDADVLGPETQIFTGRFVVLGSGDLGYSPPTDAPNDDGLVFPLDYGQAVVRYEIKTDPLSQSDALRAAISVGPADPTSTLQLATTAQAQGLVINDVFAKANIWVELELKPLTGSFENEFVVTAGPLSVPMQVNLGSA